jgi:hypothetical protein
MNIAKTEKSNPKKSPNKEVPKPNVINTDEEESTP